MFRYLAENASVPVVCHLDHGYHIDECKEAIDCGFTSVMYDGSRKPLQQNIDETAEIAQLAHAAGVSCEGEIGFVGYDNGERRESRQLKPSLLSRLSYMGVQASPTRNGLSWRGTPISASSISGLNFAWRLAPPCVMP